jgi:hypothetical protein
VNDVVLINATVGPILRERDVENATIKNSLIQTTHKKC